MPFVKIDTDILRSTLWYEPVQLKLFLTALLMAEPREYREPVPTLPIDSLEPSEFVVPAGEYGFVPSAGIGIVHQALVDPEVGMPALKALGQPEATTRSQDFEGRRMVRIDGGFLVLNYMKYRERDYTAAERSARYRERKRTQALQAITDRNIRDGYAVSTTASHRDITQAEAEAEAEVPKTKRESEPAAPAPAVAGHVLQQLWNERAEATGLPRCRALTPKRLAHCERRLTEQPVPYWVDVVARIQASAFCRGVNDRGWVATFDWLIASSDNAVKVLEGKYDDRPVMVRRNGNDRRAAEAAPDYPVDWACDHDPECPNREWHAMKLAEG